MSDFEHSLDDGPAPGPGEPLGAFPELRERYRVVRPLGQGGMGQVFLADDVEAGRPVAIKLVSAQDERAARRFVQEAETIGKLDSPHVVGLHDVIEGADALAIVMEYVDGPDLEEYARGRGPLPWREAVGLLIGVVDGLAHAHRRGVVHRDVKPANVLLTADGSPKLCDFGLARSELVGSLDGSLTQEGALVGTLDYMAPEQRKDARRVDARADLFGVGATLYRLITGSSPRLIRESQIPAEVRPLVLRCLEESPGGRHPSAEALGRAMRELVPEAIRLPPVLTPPPAPDAAPVAPTAEAPIEAPAPDFTAGVVDALDYQARHGGPIEEALGLVGLEATPAVYAVMAAARGLAVCDGPLPAFDAEAPQQVSRAVADAYRLAPTGSAEGGLTVAAADPGLGAILDVLELDTGAAVHATLAPPEAVAARIEEVYGPLPEEERPRFVPAPAPAAAPAGAGRGRPAQAPDVPAAGFDPVVVLLIAILAVVLFLLAVFLTP